MAGILKDPAEALAYLWTLNLVGTNARGVGTQIARSSDNAISTNRGGVGRHALPN